jgi:hypothetical protein
MVLLFDDVVASFLRFEMLPGRRRPSIRPIVLNRGQCKADAAAAVRVAAALK